MIEIRPGRHINITVLNPHLAKQRVIFLLHGLSGRADQWDAIAELLKEHGCIIIPDMLGHGKSNKPNNETLYSFSEFYQDFKAVFEKYASQNNVVIGHSMGGACVTFLASEVNGRIQKLILSNPIMCKPYPLIPKVFWLPISWLEFIKIRLAKILVTNGYSKNIDQAIILKETIAAAENPMYVVKPLVMSLRHIPVLDVSNIHVDTLLLTAEFDPLSPTKMIYDFYASMPNLTHQDLKGYSHMTIIEIPNIIADQIIKFIS